jgi:hypothetical protein
MKQIADRFLVATFCDDIRQEIGNKYSLMGCYGGELTVPAIPVILAKLCVLATVWTPKDRPFQSLVLSVMQDDDTEMNRLAFLERDILLEMAQLQDKTATRIGLSAAITFSPFVIEKPTLLRLVATTEEGEILGPDLSIKLQPGPAPLAQPAAAPKPAKPRPAKKKTAGKP